MKDNIDEILQEFQPKEEELIPVLQKVQVSQGFISLPAMSRIAAYLNIPESKVFSVATFYEQFRFVPKGKKHIMLCRGTACHVKNAPRILEEIEKQIGIKSGETGEDGEFSLEEVACIGACSLAPCIVVNDEVKGNLTPQTVRRMFRNSNIKDDK